MLKMEPTSVKYWNHLRFELKNHIFFSLNDCSLGYSKVETDKVAKYVTI